MTPYFFKQMRKRTSLCLVVVLTALAFSLALCMLQRSRDQMAARIEEVYDNLEVRCSVTNLTGTQSDQLNLPDWVLRLFDGEKTYGKFQDNDLFAPYVRDVQVRSTVYCTTPGDQDRLTLSGVTGLKADSSLLASSGCTVIWREVFGEDMFRGRGFSLLLPEEQAHLVDGDGCTITVAPKGFGSENMSRIQMLKPADGVEGFQKFVLDTVQQAGSNPCPPIVLGIGVGGSFDKVAYLAKKALLRPLDVPNPDPYYAGLERELLTAINELGIGPQGFGGQTTCLGLAIEQMPTHVAGLPVAVNVSCHVTRRASAEL